MTLEHIVTRKTKVLLRGWKVAMALFEFVQEQGVKRSVYIFAALLWLCGSVSSAEETSLLYVTQAGAQLSTIGPAEHFTGRVRVDNPFKGTPPARVSGATVSFEPGARTAWHTHPLGQTLIVISGNGLVQEWGGPVRIIKPGDTVWIAPGIKHWHGATANVAMTHIAIVEMLGGKTVNWMEKVTDEQYRAQP